MAIVCTAVSAVLENSAPAQEKQGPTGPIQPTIPELEEPPKRRKEEPPPPPLTKRESEAPWVWWRLHSVRRWSHGTTEQVLG